MKTFPLFLLSLTSLAWTASADVADLIKQGDVYDKQLKPEPALKNYLPAEKEDPNNGALLVKIARQYIFRMDDLSSKSAKLESAKTALSYAERAVKVAPQESDSHLSVAICVGKMTPLLSTREQVEASRKIKTSAEKAVKLNPGDDYAWHMLGRWHQALADTSSLTRGVAQIVYGGLPPASFEEAENCFKKAIAINPKRLIHQIELGRTYALMGKTEEAKTLLNKGLAMPNMEKDDAETKQRGRAALAKL